MSPEGMAIVWVLSAGARWRSVPSQSLVNIRVFFALHSGDTMMQLDDSLLSFAHAVLCRGMRMGLSNDQAH